MQARLHIGMVYVLDEHEKPYSTSYYTYLGLLEGVMCFRYKNPFGNGVTTKETIGVIWMKQAPKLAQVLYGL